MTQKDSRFFLTAVGLAVDAAFIYLLVNWVAGGTAVNTVREMLARLWDNKLLFLALVFVQVIIIVLLIRADYNRKMRAESTEKNKPPAAEGGSVCRGNEAAAVTSTKHGYEVFNTVYDVYSDGRVVRRNDACRENGSS